MYNLMFVLLFTIVWSSLFVKCDGNSDALGELKNAFSTKFDRIVELIEHQSTIEDNKSYIEENNYNDTKCYEQMTILLRAFNMSELWALKVFDSWGKLPSGIFSGNFMEQGDFDQCFSILEAEKFEPQYCWGVISQWDPQTRVALESQNVQTATRAIHRSASQFANRPRMGPPGGSSKLGLKIGICVPNTCSSQVINKIVQALATQLPIKVVEYATVENSCQVNEQMNYTLGDIGTISLLSFLAFLTIISTAYDVMCTRLEKNKIDVLTAFSIHSNASKIFATKCMKSIDVLDCLNGIRVLSTIWVVYGHSVVLAIPSPVYNFLYLPKWASEWFSLTLLMAPLSVDTFLFLSGFLVTWHLMKHFNKTNGKINIPLLYLHRYLRLTPLLAVAIVVTSTILTKYSNGPLWHTLVDGNTNCDDTWWAALLYIQNYYNPSNICFGHSWYLSVDFQLFLIAPWLVYWLYCFGHKCIPILLVGISASMAANIFIMWRHNLSVKYMDFANDIMKTMSLTYFPTHTRMAPWIVGMIFAYILFSTRGKHVHFTKVHATICWALMLIIFGLCTWYTFVIQQMEHPTTGIESGIYLALTRTMWPVGVSLLVLLCVRGYAGPVNRFFSSPRWLPFCRLSYAIYIVHMPIILVFTASSRRSFYFSNQTLIIRFFGNLVISFVVCVIAALLCESPILKIEKFLISVGRKPVERTEPSADTSATSQQDLLNRTE